MPRPNPIPINQNLWEWNTDIRIFPSSPGYYNMQWSLGTSALYHICIRSFPHPRGPLQPTLSPRSRIFTLLFSSHSPFWNFTSFLKLFWIDHFSSARLTCIEDKCLITRYLLFSPSCELPSSPWKPRARTSFLSSGWCWSIKTWAQQPLFHKDCSGD